MDYRHWENIATACSVYGPSDPMPMPGFGPHFARSSAVHPSSGPSGGGASFVLRTCTLPKLERACSLRLVFSTMLGAGR